MVRSHDDGESILTRTIYWNEMRMQLWLQFHRKALHSSDLARNEVERYTHTQVICLLGREMTQHIVQ